MALPSIWSWMRLVALFGSCPPLKPCTPPAPPGIAGAPWRRRLVLVYRAYTTDPVRPHISEAGFFWRDITEQQLTDLLECLVQLLLRSAFDQSGLQGVVHERLLHIQVEVRPFQIDYVNPTGARMTFRGEKTEGFYGGMVELMSTRKTV